MCEFNINGNIIISRGEIPLWTKPCYSIYRLQPSYYHYCTNSNCNDNWYDTWKYYKTEHNVL